MHRVFFSLLTAVAVVILPQLLTAQEEKRSDRPWRQVLPGPPLTGRPYPPPTFFTPSGEYLPVDVARWFGTGPEPLLKQLDANHDGVITPDEIPADAPEELKALLKRADKKGDGNVTMEELREAMKDFRPGRGYGAGGFGFRSGGVGGYGARGGAGGYGTGGYFGFGRSSGGPPPHEQSEPPHEGPPGRPFDLKALFDRMDKNKDGKLSFEEFSEAVKEVHRSIAARFAGFGMPGGPGPRQVPRGPMPGGPMGWGGPHRPMPGGPMGWGGPHGPRPGGPMGWDGGGIGWGGGPMGWHGPPGPMAGGRGFGGGPMSWGGWRGPRGPMGWHGHPGPAPGGPMSWWGHAARLPLPPFAPGHHFGAISKRLLEGAEKAKEHGPPAELRERFEGSRLGWPRMEGGWGWGPGRPGTEGRPEEQAKAWEAKRKAWEARRGGEGGPAEPRPGFRPPLGFPGPYAERPRPDLQRVHRELEEVAKRLKALEAKLGAAEPHKATVRSRKPVEGKPGYPAKPPKKD